MTRELSVDGDQRHEKAGAEVAIHQQQNPGREQHTEREKPQNRGDEPGQTVSGMRIMVMPLARISSVVVIKFSAPISAPMQKIAMLIIHKSAPSPSPGPADCRALSGEIGRAH